MVEVTDKDIKKLILEVVNDHVVEEGFQHEELGIRGFDSNLFAKCISGTMNTVTV